MRTKRKRVRELLPPAKRTKTTPQCGTTKGALSRSVLSHCYPEVLSLRQFLFKDLPSSSRVRRRKIAAHVLEDGTDFLDTTLVGISTKAKPALEEERQREFVAFTQSQQRASHSSNGSLGEDHLAEVSWL
jgi:hypothetical protein